MALHEGMKMTLNFQKWTVELQKGKGTTGLP